MGKKGSVEDTGYRVLRGSVWQDKRVVALGVWCSFFEGHVGRRRRAEGIWIGVRGSNKKYSIQKSQFRSWKSPFVGSPF